jgi:hypothetical protein
VVEEDATTLFGEVCWMNSDAEKERRGDTENDGKR